MTKHYAMLRKGEGGPYVDTSTVSLLLEQAKDKALLDGAECHVLAVTMPVVGHTVLTEDEAERIIYPTQGAPRHA